MVEPVQIEPQDQYNEELIGNVHPGDWVNPRPAGKYNLVVIGAGTAGLVTAAGAAGLGAKVALVERHLMGGDCLNVGCVPSKAILRAAEAAADVRNAEAFGVIVPSGMDVDFAATMERMRRLRSQISKHDSADRFTELGVDVFLGDARFASDDTVEVAEKKLRFAKAVIATGARAAVPPIEGLQEAGYLTNETVFSLTKRPPRLAVFGAGPLGCELAQAFCRLGSKVTIIEKSDHLLPREDRDAAALVSESFEKDGLNVMLNTTVRRIGLAGGEKQLHVTTDGREEVITVDEILLGAGRSPNVEGLNLDAVGVKYDTRTGVQVDDHLRTTNKRIFAAGDSCLRFKFTHTADASARIVLRNALFWGSAKLSALTVPWCTYTDPAIAHVGLYEQEARDRGIEVVTYERRFCEVDRAVTDSQENGLIKVHVRKRTDKIVGATIVARNAGDMISEITLAIVNKIGLGKIADVIHPYPTQAEAIKQIADAYNRTRMTPRIKKIFKWLMAWQR